MLNSDDNENGKNKSESLIVQHTFLYINFLSFCCCTTKTWNFLVTRFMQEMSYMCSHKKLLLVFQFGKLSPFTFKIEVLIVLHISW